MSTSDAGGTDDGGTTRGRDEPGGTGSPPDAGSPRDVAPSRSRRERSGREEPSSEPSSAAPLSATPGRSDASESSDSAQTVRPPVPLTQQIGRVVVFLLAVLFGVFAVANSQSVDFSWIFGGTEVQVAPDGTRVAGGVPLIVLMLGSAVVGAGVTGFLVWQAGRARRRARGRAGH